MVLPTVFVNYIMVFTNRFCQLYHEKSDRKIRSLLQWEQRESNPRPSACKADALNQLSYAPKLAPEPGLEPGTL